MLTWTNGQPNSAVIFRGLPVSVAGNATSTQYTIEGASVANGQTSEWVVAVWKLATNTIYATTNFVIYVDRPVEYVTSKELDGVAYVTSRAATNIVTKYRGKTIK